MMLMYPDRLPWRTIATAKNTGSTRRHSPPKYTRQPVSNNEYPGYVSSKGWIFP